MISINSAKTALKALDHEDSGVRYHGAWWLGKNRATDAVPKLVECLKDERDITSAGGFPLRRQAARSLGMIKDPSCIPALLKTLDTDDVQLHEATLRALIEINNTQCISSLINYLDKNIDNKPIEALIEALTTHKVWQVQERVRPYLESNSERIACSAATYLFSCTGAPNHLNTVVSFLDHQNRFVRQSAAFDLARIATIKAATPIINANIPNNIKMFAIKSILNESITQTKQTGANAQTNSTTCQINLFEKLDELAQENFAGNLLIDSSNSNDNPPFNHGVQTRDGILSIAYSQLRSPSLTDRETGINLLICAAKTLNTDLIKLYFSESDQDVKMGLIKAMSARKNIDYIPAFFDAIGVEIGNHCQGNIRRVAACALGIIDWQNHTNTAAFDQTMEKLSWTLHHPEDWGLRYSACLSFNRIGTSAAAVILLNARRKESDPVVSKRIEMALFESDAHL